LPIIFGKFMKLTVIIPIYNEASTLGALLSRVEAVDIEKEILVVDDGSDVATKEALKDAISGDIKLITHPENKGKGSAIRTALSNATGDTVIIQESSTATRAPGPMASLTKSILRACSSGALNGWS
jgi:cellulose synthase/poly-beta-1,6-N-acetylglucosamine synthase-like glycosyltransferase